MAILITHTAEQRQKQVAIIAALFRLPDAHDILEGWHLESYGTGATIKIELVKMIDSATVNQILNAFQPVVASENKGNQE